MSYPYLSSPAERRQPEGQPTDRAWWLTGLIEGSFFVLSWAVIAAAHEMPSGSSAARAVAVLAVTTGVAMHVRLAGGRSRAASHTLAAAGLLVALGAARPLVAGVLAMGLVGSELVASCASRACVLRAGIWTAGLGALTRICFELIGPRSNAADVVIDAIAYCAGGLLGASALLAVGPIAEWTFGHLTRLTMNELLDYEHPLLRELMTSAPGTFQHSVNVGLLADAAARAIKADALLARVGGLYHDVGKMRAPSFFIENQDGANPHDTIDPRESAAILRAHVSDGVDLVRKHRLGERIADFVREHHGTGSMRGFQAKEEALDRGHEPDGTYRYGGPTPQSRETAIVMIADQLEATARATPPADDDARGEMVRQALARIQAEDQFDDSGLSLPDLSAVQTAFERALQAMHHRRLTYPHADPEQPRRSPLVSVTRAFRRRRAG